MNAPRFVTFATPLVHNVRHIEPHPQTWNCGTQWTQKSFRWSSFAAYVLGVAALLTFASWCVSNSSSLRFFDFGLFSGTNTPNSWTD